MRFVLIGPVKGHTRVCFGFKFTNGVADIPGEAVAACGHVLREHYSAFPVGKEAEQAQAAFDAEHPGYVVKPSPRGAMQKTPNDVVNEDGSIAPQAGSTEAATLEEAPENPAAEQEESPKGKSGKVRGK